MHGRRVNIELVFNSNYVSLSMRLDGHVERCYTPHEGWRVRAERVHERRLISRVRADPVGEGNE